MCFTGSPVSVWGPIKYTLAMACPVFAYVLAVPSKLAKSDEMKISFFYSYCVALYVIVLSSLQETFGSIGTFKYSPTNASICFLIKGINSTAVGYPIPKFSSICLNCSASRTPW